MHRLLGLALVLTLASPAAAQEQPEPPEQPQEDRVLHVYTKPIEPFGFNVALPTVAA